VRDKIGGSPHAAGQIFDHTGAPLNDPNGARLISEAPDGNSLLKVGDSIQLVTHYEFDYLFANGGDARGASGWFTNPGMSMTVTELTQSSDGMLSAASQNAVDFSSVNGVLQPCFASQTPWNTHLGSEEAYASDARTNVNGIDNGLGGLTNLYLKGEQANPYHYGYLPEVIVEEDGSSSVKKHYAVGRGIWEMGLVLDDQKTVYLFTWVRMEVARHY